MMPSVPAFEDWLRLLPGFEACRVTSIEPVDGGVSNITCRATLTGADRDAVALRVQREHGIFEPYDVVREAEVLRRLRQSPVPVPEVLATETLPATLGAPFIVLEWIDAPHMGNAPDADFGAFTRMVAQIHALDFHGLGLDDVLPVPDSAASALGVEIETVEQRRTHFAGADEPMLIEARDVLRATIPTDGQLAFCQGDINVFNYLFRDGQVAAVVDWEQARISDPRSDVGQLLALSLLKGAPEGPADQQGFALAYGAITGAPLAGMAWFRARWLWELGVIYHGWLGFSGSTPWYTHELLSELLRAAISELRHG